MILKAFFKRRSGTTPPADPANGTARDPLHEASIPAIEAALHAGRHADALALAERGLATAPENAALNRLAGEVHLALGDFEAATDCFDLALHHAPGEDASLAGLLRALRGQGRESEAAAALGEFLASHPASAVARYESALVDDDAGRPAAAMDHLRRLLEAHPEHVEAMNMLALLLLREGGDIDAAEPLLREVLRRTPGHPAASANMGWVLASRGRLDAALECFSRALADAPADAETRLMRALALLANADWPRGWDAYAARLEAKLAPNQPYAYPRWGGDADELGRGALLVVQEQGLGDQIMFSSCMNDLVRRVDAKRVVLDCDARLAPLFRRSFPAVQVVGRVPGGSAADLSAAGVTRHVMIGDLPRRFRRSADAFPRHDGYLVTDPVRDGAMARRLAALGEGPRVGLSWRGGTRYSRTAVRSFGLDTFAPLMRAVPGRYVSLQYGSVASDLESVTEVTHWQDAIDDFDLTASLVASLDAVVTVCTTVAHLAGALGKTCFVLVPIAPEWRYGIAGETMAWYPSVRLFRQTRPGVWDDVVARVIEALVTMK